MNQVSRMLSTLGRPKRSEHITADEDKSYLRWM